MEIVRIFSTNESLYRGKNCSPNTIYLYNLYAISFQISVPNRHPPSNPREICPCIRESRGMYRLWTDRYSDIEGENSGLIRQRRTYAPFALDLEGEGTFQGRNLADRDIKPVSEHTEREREREREGGQLCEIHISSLSCNRYPRSAHASHDPSRRADNLCFGTGMIRFATTSPVVDVQM